MENTVAVSAEQFQEAYLDYVLTEGKPPVSVYALAKSLGADEQAFYAVYNNFTAVEQALWADLFTQTRERLTAEPAYAGYTVREKLLAFFFTWVEVLKPRRSFVLYSATTEKHTPFRTPAAMKELKRHFLAYADDLVNEGLDSGELVSRPLVSDRYAEGLWAQLVFVTHFWAQDTSTAFEQTDAAIEKAVRLGFELMGQNVVDAAADLAKFLWQSRK
ncbi:TetR family transcriptional regulator C-terminal domain-containing protein [Nostoc sp. NIES-2111]